MQKTKKKYALRKTAAYGLVSCAVGLMLVGSVPTHADEREPLRNVVIVESEVADTSGAVSEFTIFNWTGTFKSDKGEQLRDDANLRVDYTRRIHEDNNTANPWELDERTFDNMEDLNLEDHRFFGYGEPNIYSTGENVFTIPGRIGDYYLASYDGNKIQHIGQNLGYTLQDNIYNEIGKQVQIVNRESNFVYRQKDTKITLRLIDAENPKKVYRTIEVPAFTNYEHNDLDTHVFDSFKSEGALLDNLPNEVALENDGKTIDIRLKKTKSEIKVVYKNADGTVYKEFVVSADKGTILDASDLEMLPDDMEFNDDFMFYEVKGDGADDIERIVKKLTSDQGSQTDNPDTSDGSTQTDTPDSKDNGTQTDNPDTSDGSTQTDEPTTSDNGTQTDHPTTSGNGTQTDNPATTDTGTQTKVEIPVTYKFEDGTVYKSFTITEDRGYIVDGSDLEMLPDNMDFADDFVTYEVKGGGTDSIVRIVKNVVDQGNQTETPSINDGSTQTEEPTTSDDGTQTDNPDTTDAEKQTNSLPLAEKKLTKTQNNKPNLLQKHKTQYTSSNRGANKLPQAGSKEQSTLGILGVSMLVTGGIVRIFKRKKYTN